MKKILLTLVLIISGLSLAQEKDSDNERLHMTAGLQTNHLWRGLIITDKPIVSAQVYYDLDKSKHFQLGVWGATAVANDSDGTHYKEINYYIQYSGGGFTVGLWDLYNSRSINTAIASNDIFRYSPNRTAHILDLRSSYQFKENFPLRLEADFLLYGGANAGEVKLNDKGEYDSNKYSTYVEVSYPFIRDIKINLKGFVGAGFAFNPGDNKKGEKTFLYGNGKNQFDIVNIGFTASKKIKIFESHIPVSVTTMWNPSLKFARIQLATTIF